LAATGTSRRRALWLFAWGTLGVVTHHRAGGTVGAKKRKKKGRDAKPNAFGCLDVGKPCRGKDALCCSGICAGKKPGKGKQDKRTCAAHNTGGCLPERSFCVDSEAFCSPTAACLTTTGNAGFCAEDLGFDREVNCQPCVRDTECEQLGFAAGSACVILRTEGFCEEGCEGINGSTGTACIAPGA
jgi:hypothetical protein